MYTIIGGDNKEYGPVTAEQIKTWLEAKRLSFGCLVKVQGSNEWRKLGDVPELAGLYSPPVIGEHDGVSKRNTAIERKPQTKAGFGLILLTIFVPLIGIPVLLRRKMVSNLWGRVGLVAWFIVQVLVVAAHISNLPRSPLQPPAAPQQEEVVAKDGQITHETTLGDKVIKRWVTDAPPEVAPVAPVRITKAQWRSKLNLHFGKLAQLNVIYGKAGDIKNIMGNPDRTDTVGDQADWYYECSDGTIQLSMSADYLGMGIVQGHLNDY